MTEVSREEATRYWLGSYGDRAGSSRTIEPIHPNCEFLGWGRTVQGKAGWMKTREQFLAAFDPLEVTVVDLTCSLEVVSGHARLAAKHRRSQREVDVFFSFFVRWHDGQIIWMRSLLDTSSLLAQLNLLDLKRWDAIFE